MDIKTMMSAYIHQDVEKINVDWYFSIDKWDKYCDYISSEKFSNFERPSKEMFNASTFKGVSHDE